MSEFLTGSEEEKDVPSFPGIERYIKSLLRRKSSVNLLCLHLTFYLPKSGKQYSKENLTDYLYDEF
ncbi:hypothetical protein [Enterococcus faecium]|uniref:Uncharacterized protein n=1 Tax=Enterococcus faecium TaxID=1352 RepID=A0A242B0Z6_ENTFC|nr:hypothetical protein [Enterococcus faecium]OTN86666.1 hypothetical protein A5810_002991 [Enterococcus faecium]